MKVGIMLPNYAQWLGSRQLKDVVRRAEELGYDSLWVNDHVLLPADRAALYGNGFKDPYPTLAYCAALSDTLLLGTSVSVIPYRNPIVTAKMVASIDVLSDGRVMFGIGAGHEPGESEALGIPYEERGAMTDEYLKAMIAVWTQEICAFHGRYVDFSATKPILKPVQQPYPPIHVGGRSRRAMRRAVELGQAWHPSALSPDQLQPRIAMLREMESSQQRTAPVEVSLRWAVHLVESSSAEGGVSSRGETQRRQMSAETAAHTLRRYQELGVSHIAIDLPAHRIGDTANVDVFAEQMERFAREVKPAVMTPPPKSPTQSR